MPDGHDIAERARLISHRHYADEIVRTPSIIEQAKRILQKGDDSGATTQGERMWLRLLSCPQREVIQRMLEDTPEGRLLRSNSPFSILIGVSDENERRQIWRQAKSELLAGQTSKELSAA